MSKTVDERVVEMKFDNKQFEQNVSTTMSTLDKLKQKLNLSGASKGLENVNSAAKKVDMAGLSSAVETVQAKFSALQVMGVTALANITNSAVNAGKRIVSALTIDPIKTGFQEYETQINAVQTILANTQSKGSTLGDVNAALDELNTYADKTIYNFTEMTRNIGTFTAAGVDLDKSVTSIKGIANLAAVSGSTSQQASTAMYQLSQALAAGKVQLMDWNSVVNAGMGGQVFQDALKRTATQMGYNVDELIAKYGSFRESLTQGEWLTADVLTETLTQLSGAYSEADLIAQGYTAEQAKEITELAETAVNAATKVKTFSQLWDTLKEAAQSGWTQTWEILVGDFEEAKEFLTELSDMFGDMINKSSTARNDLLYGAMTSNWKKVTDGITEAGISADTYQEKIKEIAKEQGIDIDSVITEYGSLEKAFKNGALSSDLLNQALISVTGTAEENSQKLAELTGEYNSNSAILKALTDAGYKEADIQELITKNMNGEILTLNDLNDAQLTSLGYTAEQIQSIRNYSGNLELLNGSLNDFINNVNKPMGREMLLETIKVSLNNLISIFEVVGKAWRDVFPPMTSEQLLKIVESIKNFATSLTPSEETLDKIYRTFKGLFSILAIGKEIVVSVVRGIINLLSNFSGLGENILNASASLGDWLFNLRETVTETNFFGNAVDKAVGFLSKAITKVKEFIKSINDGISNPKLEGFLGFFSSLFNIVKTVASGIVNAMSSIGSSIAEAFGKGDFFEVLNSGLIVGIVYFIRNITKSISDGLGDGIEGISGVLENVKGILDDVRGCFQAYQTQLKAGALLKIASAIAILAAAIFVISTIDPEDLGKALVGISVLFGELLGSLAIFNKMGTKMKSVTKASALMITMSISILILASALKKISTLDWEGIAKGIVGVGALMAELSIFLRTAKFGGKVKSTATGIVILSSAMLILAQSVKVFGNMEWSVIGKGLASIGALLAELAIFSRLTSNAKHVMSTGVAMVLLGASMKIFASAIKDFGQLGLEKIGRGLLSMAGALAEITIAMRLMPKNMFSLGTGLVIVASAMKILASTMLDFGGMDWDEIAKGLVVMGGALAELTIALNLMKGTIAGSAALIIAASSLAIIAPVMKSLGGMSWTEIAKGLVVIAGAFAVVRVAGLLLKPLIPSILGLASAFALFGVATFGIGAGLTLIGIGLIAISAGLTAFAGSITANATAIIAGLTIIIIGFLDLIPSIARSLGEGLAEFAKVIGELAPQFAESILKLVSEVMRSLAVYTPDIVDSLMVFLIGVINALAEHLPTLIVAVVNLIGKLFEGIIIALNGIDSTNLIKAIAAVGLIAGLTYALSGIMAFVPGAMAGILGVSLVIAELALVLAAIGGLAQIPGVSWIIGEGGKLLQTIGTAIGQFIGGIVGGIAQGFTNSLPVIGTNLSDFMTNIKPFIDGASSIKPETLSGVKALAEAILTLTAVDLLNSLTSWFTGGNSLANFGSQLGELGSSFRTFVDRLGPIGPAELTSVAAAANIIKTLATAAKEIPNEGGLWASIVGDNSLASFGKELPILATNLNQFAANLGTFDESTVTTVTCAADSIKALALAAKEIPNEGGLWGAIVGDNSLSTWGDSLPGLASNLSSFASNLGSFDESTTTTVTCAADSIKALALAAKEIPNDGGLWSAIVGDNSLSTFGESLPDLGTNLNGFATNLGTFDESTVTTVGCAAQAIAAMAKAASEIDGQSGWAKVLFGDDSLSAFSEELPTLGTNLNSFATNLGTFDESKVATVNSAVRAVKAFAGLADSDLKTAKNNISGFGSELGGFGEDISAFVSNMPSSESISSAIDGLDNILLAIDDIAAANFGSVSGFTDSLGKLGSDGVSAFVEAFTSSSAKTDVKDSAIELVKKIIEGIEDSEPDVETALKDMASDGADALKEKRQAFYNAASYLVTGFANGISENSYRAEAKARAMASAAVNAAEKELDINSPSKVFQRIGRFVPEGFAIGINKYSDMVEGSAISMADNAIEGTKKIISRLGDLVSIDEDYQPTIRPVLDLSEVESGASEINGMLRTSPSIDILSNVGTINTMMNRRSQTMDNSDIVSAIDDLRKDLGNVSNTSYTINGVTYDDGSNISEAVKTIVRAARIERRV